MICSMEHQGTSGMKSGPQESTICVVSTIRINIMLCVASLLLNKNGHSKNSIAVRTPFRPALAAQTVTIR